MAKKRKCKVSCESADGAVVENWERLKIFSRFLFWSPPKHRIDFTMAQPPSKVTVKWWSRPRLTTSRQVIIFNSRKKRERKSHWKEMVLVNFVRHLITSFKIKYLSQKGIILIILSLLDFSVHWWNPSFSNLLNWITRNGNQVLIVGLVKTRVLSSKQSTLKEISCFSIF